MLTKTFLLSAYMIFSGCEASQIQVGDVHYEQYCLETGAGQSAMIMADLNGDNNLDLAVLNESKGTLLIFMGDGTGALPLEHTLDAGENPTSIDAGYLNGDSHVDLVVANHETSYLTLLMGNGTGGFQQASNSPLRVPIAPHPHVARVADMDRDGFPDIIVDHRNGTGLLVVRGTGKGEFEVALEATQHLVDVGGDPYRGFAIGDLNADGRLDIVTPNSDAVGVVMSEPSGALAFSSPDFLPLRAPFAVDLTDSNGDGVLDIVAVSNEGSDPVRVFHANKEEYIEAHAFGLANGAKQIITGSLNGDRFGDALISSWNGDMLVLLGGEDKVEPVPIEVTANPWGLAIGDLNGDGKDDFVVGDGISSKTHVLVSR